MQTYMNTFKQTGTHTHANTFASISTHAPPHAHRCTHIKGDTKTHRISELHAMFTRKHTSLSDVSKAARNRSGIMRTSFVPDSEEVGFDHAGPEKTPTPLTHSPTASSRRSESEKLNHLNPPLPTPNTPPHPRSRNAESSRPMLRKSHLPRISRSYPASNLFGRACL